MEESKRCTSLPLGAMFKSDTMLSQPEGCWYRNRGIKRGLFILAVVCLSAPLEFKKSRDKSTITLSFQRMVKRFLSVTTATGVASRFSRSAKLINRSAFFSQLQQPYAPVIQK